MANRISVLVALEGADEGLKRAIVSAERSLGELSSTAKTAGEKAAAGMAEVKAGMSAFGDQVATAKTQLLAFLSINWAAGKVQEIVQIADAWNMMSARLKLATAGQREYAVAQKELFDIAQRIGVPIQETATLYGKLQQAVRMLGGEQKDALTITESISQALRLSGASATEAQSSLLQFGQALASGVLRGEEFNSVVENSPRLAQALADGLNVPIGRLRKLAEEGRLTADVVVNALMSQKDKLASEYAQLPATVSQAFERLRNAFGQWISKLDESTGFTKKLAEALTWLAENLDTVMQWLKRIAEVGLAVLIYRLIPALITAWQTAGVAAVAAASATSAAWATANLSVSAAVASVGVLKTAFAVLGAFLVGWEIGTWLSEKFEIVRKAGIFMVEMLVKAVEQLRYRWEAFAAIFTSDTIAEATKRHEARLAEMNQIFAQMYADASKGADAAKGAMNTAATAAEEIAKRLEAVRQGTQEAVGRGIEAVHSALEKLKSRLGEVDQAVGKANQTVNDSTAKMAEAYKGLTTIVEANLQRQVEAVKVRFDQEKSALELSKQSEAAQITKSTQLLTEALTQQTTLRQQATTATLKLIDDEGRARSEAAQRQGQTEAERLANVTRVENEILATKRQTMTQALSEYRQHIDALNAEANRHLAEVKRIEEEKRQLSMTTDERIREIQRQGMTEFQATEDRKRQVVEYQTKAREALANGEFEQARQLAQKAMDLAAQVASSQTSEATVAISDALRFDFTGSPASRTFTRATNSTKTRDTVVADAGTYVGVVPLTQAANVGDFTIKGASIYTQLVPSAQTETPISFVPPYAAAGLPVPGAAPVSYTASHAWNTSIKFNLPGGCLPGSLSIVTDGITIFDDAGLLKTASGTLGTIDYANGILSLNSGSMSNSKAITYTPAAQLQRAPQSAEIAVTPESRSQSYVGTVNPVPQPGTLAISYMAQGRWYVLSDGGNGSLKGLDASYGAGTFNKNTGAFVVTLGALPDVGSSLILTWNVPTQETQQPTAALKASQALQLAPPEGKSVQPGTLTITWPHESGTGTRTASATTSGELSGAATGSQNVAQNLLSFAPNVLPPVGALLTVDYVAGPKQEDSFAHPSRDGQGKVPVTATLGSIEPGSLEIEWNTLTDTAVLGVYTLQQIQAMGLGLWNGVDPTQYARDDGAGNVLRAGQVIGSVNYATGAVQFQPDVTVKIPSPVYGAQRLGWASGVGQMFRLNYGGINYVDAPSLYPNDESGYVKLRYNSAGSTSNHSETFAFSPSFRLVPGVNAQVVTGTVLLAIAGSQPWGDNGQGTLREFTPSGWVTRGSINYLSGAVTLTSWSAGATNSITRASCVTTVGENISSEYVFRTGAAPLRPGSLSIQFARNSGNGVGGTQTVTAGIDGTITASGVIGSVDYDTGLVRVRFGTVVTAAGNESEPWFDAENVRPDGKIFRPEPVAASSLRYSAVAYSYLPLDAALLGIDPVRLPSDGRVPIFRPGGFAVVGHTGRITASVSNGQTIDCARVRLSRVRVVGHNGVVIHTGYVADLEAGTVTFTDVTGYSQPVTIEHRIEDMAVVRDVQINGEISFTRPLTHAYPLASPGDPVSGSFVSSALVAGDLFARVNLVFDQSTWNGSWSDELIGSAATATFNHTQYPITVTNRGALTERWVARMTNSTSFEVIGENVGVIATGNTSADCAPNNPATGVPYFRLPALGWGNGWATGNVLRFNTIGSQFPVWVVRTVQQGPESVPDDHFTLLIRGDVDTP